MLPKEFSEDFTLFLERYLNFYNEFLKTENKKYESIVQNDVNALDGFVRLEQALILASRGLEAERERFIAQSGVECTTLREIIPLLDEGCQEKASCIFTELSDSLLDLKDINSRSNQLTELRLHKINNEINKLQKQPEHQNGYNNSAKSGNKPINIISKKI